MKTYLNRKR